VNTHALIGLQVLKKVVLSPRGNHGQIPPFYYLCSLWSTDISEL